MWEAEAGVPLAGALFFPAGPAGKVSRRHLAKAPRMLGERLFEFLEDLIHFRRTCGRGFPAQGADTVLQSPRWHDSSVKETICIGIRYLG